MQSNNESRWRNITISPKISQEAAERLIETARTRNAGAVLWIESGPELYLRTLRELAGVFSAQDLATIIEAVASGPITRTTPGDNFSAVISAYLTLQNRLKDAAELIARIDSLPHFSRATLDIWATMLIQRDPVPAGGWVKSRKVRDLARGP